MNKEERKEVEVGKTYIYRWPDKMSIGQYTVLELREKAYSIIRSNGQKATIPYGCPINIDSEELTLQTGYNDLRKAALRMQVTAGNVLALGGTQSDKWWENLIDAQQGLSAQTKAHRHEFDAVRKEFSIERVEPL